MRGSFHRVLLMLAAAAVGASLLVMAGPSGAAETISFGKSVLQGATSANPTTLQFGPDGRLYVGSQSGLIKAYTVVRNGANSYSVTSTETINLIRTIPNHNDDGTLYPDKANRQVLGILVKGTASNPVLYVSSSDPRIGAGADGQGDVNLDTNSGVISRLTWNGSSWNKVDLVRGLPRSEENHSVNGLQLDEATNTIYVAVGSNTNHGAPSNNFALLPEYALSAAVLSIDLDAIGNSTYDVPTLNDEDRPGSPDANDPFGGNDGKNQARIVPGGPVQVHASGFRNPYDVLIAESGKMYTIDNSGNAGWGDVPVNEGPNGNCTNAQNEPGTTDLDTLHLISGPGYYGGHPNPTRGNTDNTFNPTNPQSPVQAENPVECDYRAPGAEKGSLASFDESTNGLAEYTASNFGGAMAGDLLATGYNDSDVYRIKLDAAGDAVVSKEFLFQSVGIRPLDVTAQGDAGRFPGSIWVADVATGDIIAFEPTGGGGDPCTGADDPSLDEDSDGFDNADEIDNGTNPCSAADIPSDVDGDRTSDLNDPDDDNDGRADTTDPFAVDEDNGKTTELPVSYTWDNDAATPGGLLNLGFTGLMTNKSSNYKSLYDSANMTAGGAAGATTIDRVPAGEAYKTTNNQKYGFQFGVNATPATGEFVARTRIKAPFAGMTPEDQQSMGLFVGNGDQDNYAKLVVHSNGGQGGIQFRKEVAGAVTTPPKAAVAMPGPDAVDLFLKVDPAAGTVQPSYQVLDGGVVGPRKNLGNAVSVPAGWFSSTTTGLAVGIISTSNGPGPEFPATWDFIEVVPYEGDTTPPVAEAPKQTLLENSSLTTSQGVPVKISWSAADSDGVVSGYELQQSTNGGAFTNVALPSATATSTTPKLDAGKTYAFRVRAQDAAGNWSAWEQGPAFKVNVLQEGDAAVSYAGGWLSEGLSSASGGSLKHASAPGDSARLAFGSALNVAWVAPKGANRGKAEVWVDGAMVKSVDLYNPSAQARRLVFTGKNLDPSVAHALEVRVSGTKNASSSGTRADVDAFVVLEKVQ